MRKKLATVCMVWYSIDGKRIILLKPPFFLLIIIERPCLISYESGADVLFDSICKAYRGMAAAMIGQLHRFMPTLPEVLRESALACKSFLKYLSLFPHILVWDRHALVDGGF